MNCENCEIKQQRDDLLEMCEGVLLLCPGWREVIAELDDMPKSKTLGKAMWICLDQMDLWFKQAKKAVANAKPSVLDKAAEKAKHTGRADDLKEFMRLRKKQKEV